MQDVGSNRTYQGENHYSVNVKLATASKSTDPYNNGHVSVMLRKFARQIMIQLLLVKVRRSVRRKNSLKSQGFDASRVAASVKPHQLRCFAALVL